ncbi:hypothetical protein DFP79_2666 [Marinomonas balearica]|uniref:Uncharacterized protein n=1 Tax=Marinomonas balearica TaxID=491947 RepID=A0A4R6M698_9GAMM|nr:hypothetical protein DFP79_2666 [Marinomonas balearica]
MARTGLQVVNSTKFRSRVPIRESFLLIGDSILSDVLFVSALFAIAPTFYNVHAP